MDVVPARRSRSKRPTGICLQRSPVGYNVIICVGLQDLNEVIELVRLLGLTWGKKRLKRAYDEMTHTGQPILGATFVEFAQWWARHRAMARYARPAMPAGVGEALVLSFVWSLAAATCAG